jgi:xanthine dehydrogenase molybdopterin-binding subunit B
MSGHQHPVTPGTVMPQAPDVAAVLQEPDVPYSVTVPVRHDGPVFSQEVPAVLGTTMTVVATTTPQMILGASGLRKKATIISTDNAFMLVARRNNATVASANALWPANVPLVYTAQTELSVATSAGTASISVITEDWSR